MAPAHSVNSYLFSSSSSEVRSNVQCKRELGNCWERSLPVSFRGRFFEDSFFESARARYEEKVKRLLEDWDAADTLFDEWCNTTSCATRQKSFRNLLSRNQGKQIVSVTTEDGELKILLDVREYTVEEIRVRVIGEREVEVEGHQKQKENEASDIYKTPNKFRYLISLPEEAEMDTITSAMSVDGILSISVPRKKTFDKICHHIPVEVQEPGKNCLSSASDSSVSINENVSDYLSQSSSTSSSNTICVNVLGKETEDSEKSVNRTNVDVIDHGSSRQLGEMQESSRTVLCVENLNDHNEGQIDDSFGIQTTTDKSSGDSGCHSQLCKMNITGTDNKASENGAKESERHISHENLCAAASFMNLPVTRKESFSNGNTKVTSSISDEEYQHNSGEISVKESATMINNSQETSVMEEAIETHRLNEDYLKSMKQPRELIVPMKLKTTRSAVHDVQIRETIGLQDEQPLTDEVNLTSVTSHCSLETSTHENEVSLAESTESTHQRESSAQKMEAYVIQDQAMTGRNSLDSSVINRNFNVFQSGSKAGKSFVMNKKTTSINEPDEITEKECPLVNYKEAQACVRSNSSISDTYEQDVQRRHSCEKNQTYSKDSLEEYQSAENTSSSAHVGVDCTTSSRNVSRNLLIAKKGSFFTDSHFEGMQEHYLTAVREVLSKYGDFPFACDELSFYRNLRLQDQRENIAAITFEKESKLHFILDLYNMKNEEINVEIVNEQKIMVRSDLREMHSEEEITRLFSKCLNVYGEVETSSAEAALSSEGVLVISIPKKVFHPDTSSTGETFQDIPISNSQTSDVYLKEVVDQNSTELSQNTESEHENIMNCFSENNWLSSGLNEPEKSVLLQDGQKGKCLTYLLDNSVVESRSQGNTEDLKHQEAENKQSICHSYVIEDSANRREFACKDQPTVELQSHHKSQQRIETADRDEIENISSYDDKKDCEVKMRQFSHEKEVLQVSQKAFVLEDGDHWTSEDLESFSSLHTDKSVNISVEERGLFHEDNFFTGMQHYLLKAIREILSNYYDLSAPAEDEMTLYRKLINNHGPKETNLTVSVSFEDEFSYKVVIDAQTFMKIRKVTLGILGDKRMDVSMEDINEAGLGKCSSKSFVVPDGLDIYNAVAMISSDGILAISIPKQCFLDDSAQQNKVEICKVNHSNDTRQSDTSNSTSTTHQKIFPEAIDVTSLQSEVSIHNSSSTVDSHILSTAKMDENVEERNSAEAVNEIREEKIQMGIGYQSKSERNQGKWDQLLNTVGSSTFKAEIEDDNGDNGIDEEEDSDSSTIVGAPCLLEINSLTDDESSIFSPNLNYAVTLAESPQVEANGLLTSEISGEYERSSKYEERNQASLAASQLLQQSSRLSIHTLEESEMDFDDSGMLSSEGISRKSSAGNSSEFNYDYLSSFGFSGCQENHCVSASVKKAYSNQKSNSNFTQSESLNRYLIPSQEELNENSRLFSSSTSTEDLSSYYIPDGHLRPTMHNIQMINSEIFGCSQTACQANASCSTASVCKQLDNKSNCLAVRKRGLFFEDSFFSDVQENFHTAMREILRKSSDEHKCKHSSEIASYKCWRKQNPSIENQAVFVCEDHHAHRVVVDIGSLLEELVSVFVVDGKELWIEGQSAIIVNTLEDPCVYSRRFVFPDQVDVDAITATLSLDGILLIIFPKRSIDTIM